MRARESVKYSFQCGLRGFHVYKEVWSPIVDEVLRCCHAIAAIKRLPGRLADCTIGHLPRDISWIIRFFLLRGGEVLWASKLWIKPPKIATCARGGGEEGGRGGDYSEIDCGDRRFWKEWSHHEEAQAATDHRELKGARCRWQIWRLYWLSVKGTNSARWVRWWGIRTCVELKF